MSLVTSATHLKTPDPKDIQLLQELESRVKGHLLYSNHSEWVTSVQLERFLIARKHNVNEAYNLMSQALEWREKRKPDHFDKTADWEEKLSHEADTGKIYIPGNDKFGRSIVIFDNSVQNTNNVDNQMTFLAWNLETAAKLMKSEVDKYVVFMHLENFSFFNMPPISSTRETIHMLCDCYPERLGHCILFQAPGVFKMVFDGLRFLIDERTVSKMIFISGDCNDGSDNDILMKQLIGDNWKVLTGAEQSVLKKGNSPGFEHSIYWASLMKRLAEVAENK